MALLVTGHMERDLARRGLSRARARIIWQLVQRGSATQRVLADALQVTPRNVTGLVDGLEADGFVVRRPHPSDRRAVSVALTPRGAAVAAALQRDAEGFAHELLGHIDETRLRELDRLLTAVIDHLRSPPDEGAAG